MSGRDREVERLLDRALASRQAPVRSAADLHWTALRMSPTARHWLHRSQVETYLARRKRDRR